MLIIVVFPKAKGNSRTLFLKLLYSGSKENWNGSEENCFIQRVLNKKNATHYIGFQTFSLFLLFLRCFCFVVEHEKYMSNKPNNQDLKLMKIS